MHVAITIVTWNSMRYLPEALASIEAQTHADWSLIIVDNASTDGVAEFVRANHPRAVFIRNTKNLGFSHGHNQAITYAKTHLQRPGEELFVLVTNPDIILTPQYVATLLDTVERRNEVGSACGKLLKVRDRADGEMRRGEPTTVIDTTGLRVRRSRLVTERGGGREDADGAFDRIEEVFGVSGALAMYRMSALDDVAESGEYFDEQFFAYKEDIDLAWRLRLRGWSALFVPRARAYHYRTASGDGTSSVRNLMAVLRARRGRSAAVSFYSYRNHFLLLMKDEHFSNALIDSPRILWNEIKMFGNYLLMQPSALRAIPAAAVLLPKTLAKRAVIMRNARVKARDIRKWFS
jgi:GT2 family glycosyltransferase